MGIDGIDNLKPNDDLEYLRMRLEGMEKREVTFRSEIEIRDRELAKHENWKFEAMAVLTRWEEVYDLVPDEHKTLGETRSDGAKEYIKLLLEEINYFRGYADRLMKELAKHGWGDIHYGAQPQDPAIVALLREGMTMREKYPELFEKEKEALYGPDSSRNVDPVPSTEEGECGA